MIVIQMLVGAVGASLCAVLLYVVVRLIVQLGKGIEGDSGFNTDVDYFMFGAFFLVAAVILASAFIVGSFLFGEKILTVLGWIG